MTPRKHIIFLLFGTFVIHCCFLCFATRLEALPSNTESPKETKLIGCKGAEKNSVTWTRNLSPLFNGTKYSISFKFENGIRISELLVLQVEEEDDEAIFSCFPGNDPPVILSVSSSPKRISSTNGVGRVGNTSKLSCSFKGKPLPDVSWLRLGKKIFNSNKYEIRFRNTSKKEIFSELKVLDLSREDNSTYLCHAVNELGSNVSVSELFVSDKPEIVIDFAFPVSQTEIYFNWTLREWNSSLTHYSFKFRQDSSTEWMYYSEKIPTTARSYLLSNLTENTKYWIKLAASNSLGSSDFSEYHSVISTLNFDPTFIPTLNLRGLTWNSISISWTQPPDSSFSFIQYYKLTASSRDTEISMFQPALENSAHYLWRDLTPATTYSLSISACNSFTRRCFPSSAHVYGTTEDGLAESPTAVEIQCRRDTNSGMNFIDVRWKEPLRPYGQIEFYNISLRGSSKYTSSFGEVKSETWGPEMKTEDSSVLQTRFDFLPSHTNYTASICAVTRRKECGDSSIVRCASQSAPPLTLNRFQWKSEELSEGKHGFRLHLSNLSERNGPLGCLRVILVKLKEGASFYDLPKPSELNLTTYESVHESRSSYGAYVNDVVGVEYMGKDILIGDGQTLNSKCHNSSGTDGPLHTSMNYTAFIEVRLRNNKYNNNNDEVIIGRSPYLSSIRPGASVSSLPTNAVLLTVLGILSSLVILSLFLLTALFVIRRYAKNVSGSGSGIEMDFRKSLRHFCSAFRSRDHSQYLITPDNSSSEMSPIHKKDLVDAFLERHKDSDYGFQFEFEQLPDRFPDRTTFYSDLPGNRNKNRYPDIKSYDQTRVKLSLSHIKNELGDDEIYDDVLDSSKFSSDYINANFVLGYKERKRWICTQGPLEHTVLDFWTMIWEQGSEILIMLTHLEEYNRIKCTQYWPNSGTLSIGSFNIRFCSETRYSDYILREFQMLFESSEPRTLYHYHYLQWKDFNAPEHSPGMLRFVKRINEAWNGSHSLVVHCSAGVGRSGTLIAIDSLIEQLRNEDSVSIFQTVSDLRHQRNYLVQSVKQYMFVYRAIMEMSQFGDTEMEASKIFIEDIESEFDRLAMVVDDRKALTVGGNEENKSKNQSERIIPYDRNRVILTPHGLKPHSTYINASFIEGYHNDESFIITQDPLPNTREDFWRMVSEHNISVMVMLHRPVELYWEEDESKDYGSHRITLNSCENNSFYIKRQFSVYNSKSNETVKLNHFEYSEWNETLPSSSYGLLDLVEKSTALNQLGPLAVHCKYGSDKSSIFVSLCCLIQQIKKESRVDIFTTVRKLRSQRQGMIKSLEQYKYLYTALSNYAEYRSRNDSEEEYSIPINSL